MKHYAQGIALILPLLLGQAHASVDLPEVITGGIGSESRQYIDEMQSNYDLKLIFTGEEGMYLSDVKVTIKNSKGEVVSTTVTDGPYLLTTLKPGKYSVDASFEEIEKQEKITLKAKRLKTVYVRFPVKDEEEKTELKTDKVDELPWKPYE